VDDAGQGRHRVGARRPATERHHRRLVPGDDVAGMLEVIDLAVVLFQ
jgi:hypothetical protein